MKPQFQTTVLQAVLAISLLLSVIFFIHFLNKSRDARNLQLQMVNIQQKRGMINQLVADVLEYSKHNPAIDPILPLGLKPSTPSGKPAAK